MLSKIILKEVNVIISGKVRQNILMQLEIRDEGEISLTLSKNVQTLSISSTAINCGSTMFTRRAL